MRRIAFVLFCCVVGTALAACPLKIVGEGQPCVSNEECANNQEVNAANNGVLGMQTLYCLFDKETTNGTDYTCQKLGTRLFGSPCNTVAQCTSGNTCWMLSATSGECRNAIPSGNTCAQFAEDVCAPNQVACGTNPCVSGNLCLPPMWGAQYNTSAAAYDCSPNQNCTCQVPITAGNNCTQDKQCQYQSYLQGHNGIPPAKCQNNKCFIIGTQGMSCLDATYCLPGLVCAGGQCTVQDLTQESNLNQTTECSCTGTIPCIAGSICMTITAGNITKQTCVPAENQKCGNMSCIPNGGFECGSGGVFFCVNSNCSLPHTGVYGDVVDNSLACGPGLVMNTDDNKCINITGAVCVAQSDCWGTGAFAYCDCKGSQTGTCKVVMPVPCKVSEKASTDYQNQQQFCCQTAALPSVVAPYFDPGAANIRCSSGKPVPWGVIVGAGAGGIAGLVLVASVLVIWRRRQLRNGYEEIPMMSTRH